MRILVTGGAGFIGSHYVRTLLTGGYPGYEQAGVTVLDKLTYAGNLANLDPVAGKPQLRFVQGDICDATLLASLLPGHDAVLNFAAETHVDRSIDGASDFVATNVVGMQVLLDACLDAGVGRVVQVSTDEVYGSSRRAPGPRTLRWHRTAPTRPQGRRRPAGPGVRPDLRAERQHHAMLEQLRPLPVPREADPAVHHQPAGGHPGAGLRRRAARSATGSTCCDHCRGIQLVLEQGTAAGVYHIDGDAELTNLELTRAILEHCGAGWDMVTPVQDRKGHDRRYSLDDGVLRALGYAPRIPFADGLTETVRWYADHRGWWEPLKRPTGGQREPLRPIGVEGEPLRSAAAAGPGREPEPATQAGPGR